ncbi:hypothetical protein [Microbacterium gorillae]|uniref:hypothetical protein n=1 Tax=Microbacterium gorillae TaxID=1231063 RepID=UPI003D97E558
MSITVQAIRFSDDVAAMRALLEQLGLVAVVSSPQWAVMRSGSGDVLLHGTANAANGAPAGSTELTFETDDLDAVAVRFDVAPVDEAWGRSIEIVDPLGDRVIVNAQRDDFYGYETLEALPDPSISVCPVRFTDPRGAYGEFLTELGLHQSSPDDDSFVAYGADHGSVGVHIARPEETVSLLADAPGAQVHLTLSTTGDPQALAAALRSAGHEVRVDTTFGTMLELTDPDGRSLQIHAEA